MKTEIRWFVIVWDRGHARPLPIIDDGYLVLFPNLSDAEKAGEENPLGFAYGYDCFQVEVET